MWAAIGTALTALLPLLVKLIWLIIQRKDNNDQLRKDMLALIDSLSKEDIPIKLHDKYNLQIERLRKQIEDEKTKGTL